MDGGAGSGNEVGDVFVAVVGIVGGFSICWAEDERAGGDGFGGIPNVGVEEGIISASEVLDTEVVVVDETLEGFHAVLLRAHFDAAAHAVEGHGDHGIAGLPADRTVFGVVLNGPDTCLSFNEGLVAIGVIFRRKVIDGGVLVEIVSGVGLPLGGGAVADVVVGVRDLIGGNQFIADVIAVLFIVLGGTAAKEVAVWFVRP